jgi:IMP dehydrogenase/GMP reductase
MQITEALCFDDVLLRPNFFEGKSRRDIDLKTSIAGLKLDIPIISANMPCISGYKMAMAMHKLGGLCILDRMTCDQVTTIQTFVRDSLGGKIGASIGIQGSNQELMEEFRSLVDAGASIICIDVAHGAQTKTFEVIKLIRSHKQFEKFPLIVGNFADFEGSGIPRSRAVLNDYYICWKLGVGSGAACSTRIKTGCGLPTFQSLLDWGDQSDCYGLYAPHVIADGGMKTSGDIVKSLAAGAKAVMLGSLLAGTDESEGETIKDDKTGNRYKIYRGNASAGSKIAAGLRSEFIEGAESLVKCKGPVGPLVEDLLEGIRSGLSYCGVSSLKDLPARARFVKVSSSGHQESKPHGIL